MRRNFPNGTLTFVIAGHSRTKDGVASLAYDAAIHDEEQRVTSVQFSRLHGLMDARVKPAHDAECVAPSCNTFLRQPI